MGFYYTLVPFICPQYNNVSNNLLFCFIIFTCFNLTPAKKAQKKRHQPSKTKRQSAKNNEMAPKKSQMRSLHPSHLRGSHFSLKYTNVLEAENEYTLYVFTTIL